MSATVAMSSLPLGAVPCNFERLLKRTCICPTLIKWHVILSLENMMSIKAANAHIKAEVKCSVKVLLRSSFLAIAFCSGVKILGKCKKKRREKNMQKTLRTVYLTKTRMDMLRPKLAQFRISGEQAASFQ